MKPLAQILAESREWLMGTRSHWNEILNASDDRAVSLAMIAKADAAECEAAYWRLRAHQEGLLNESDEPLSINPPATAEVMPLIEEVSE